MPPVDGRPALHRRARSARSRRPNSPPSILGDPTTGVVATVACDDGAHIRLLAVDPSAPRRADSGHALVQAAEDWAVGGGTSEPRHRGRPALLPVAGRAELARPRSSASWSAGTTAASTRTSTWTSTSSRSRTIPAGTPWPGAGDAAELDAWMATTGPTGGSKSCARCTRATSSSPARTAAPARSSAFCAFEVNRRGLLGPVAVRPELMGRGRGKGVLLGALHELRRRGAQTGRGRLGGTGDALRRSGRPGERRVLRLPQGAGVNLLPVPRPPRADRRARAEPAATAPDRPVAARTGLRVAHRRDRVCELAGADDAGLFYGDGDPGPVGVASTTARCRPASSATIPTSRFAASCSTSPATRCRPWTRCRP